MAKSWLFTEDGGIPLEGKFQVVFRRQQATEMTYGNAHQLMRAAEKGYRNYTWELIKIDDNSFIVEGTEKGT